MTPRVGYWLNGVDQFWWVCKSCGFESGWAWKTHKIFEDSLIQDHSKHRSIDDYNNQTERVLKLTTKSSRRWKTRDRFNSPPRWSLRWVRSTQAYLYHSSTVLKNIGFFLFVLFPFLTQIILISLSLSPWSKNVDLISRNSSPFSKGVYI